MKLHGSVPTVLSGSKREAARAIFSLTLIRNIKTLKQPWNRTNLSIGQVNLLALVHAKATLVHAWLEMVILTL